MLTLTANPTYFFFIMQDDFYQRLTVLLVNAAHVRKRKNVADIKADAKQLSLQQLVGLTSA